MHSECSDLNVRDEDGIRKQDVRLEPDVEKVMKCRLSRVEVFGANWSKITVSCNSCQHIAACLKWTKVKNQSHSDQVPWTGSFDM